MEASEYLMIGHGIQTPIHPGKMLEISRYEQLWFHLRLASYSFPCKGLLPFSEPHDSRGINRTKRSSLYQFSCLVFLTTLACSCMRYAKACIEALSCQMLKVACLIHGHSPIPTEVIKPGLVCKLLATASTCFQKRLSFPGRILARVSTAIGPE